MTLEQLRIFVGVAERLHMTRAAEALHITQSAASAAVAALETRHGVKLFDRVGRGLRLSQAGQVFLPEDKAVLSRAEAAGRALDDLAGLRRGSLVLAASQTVASYWLPPRMARFAAAQPGIALRLIVGNTAQVAQLVIDGGADLGFVEGEVDQPALARQPVARDRIALFAGPGHPLAGRLVSADDLRRAPWVLREPGSGTRSQLEAALARRGLGVEALPVALELPSNEAMLAAAVDGALIVAVSELAAEVLVRAGRLVRLEFDLVEREFVMIAHRERIRSHAAKAFIDQAEFAERTSVAFRQ